MLQSFENLNNLWDWYVDNHAKQPFTKVNRPVDPSGFGIFGAQTKTRKKLFKEF